MELLELNDKYLTKYDVSYDLALMQAFLERVINDYSKIEYLQRKAKNESEIISYYTKYDVCKDLKFIKVCEDNTRVHKGRKRVPSKTQIKKNLYSFTVVTYPDIYYTIKYFLGSKTADFSMFNIFLEPSNYVPCNHYDNRKQMDLINNELIKRLKEQSNCLKELLDLLTFTVIEQREINNYEIFNMPRRLLHGQLAYINTFIDPTHDLINNVLDNPLTYKEVNEARENYMTIAKIKNLSKDNVKVYSNLRI
jgi:hypothetical protein